MKLMPRRYVLAMVLYCTGIFYISSISDPPGTVYSFPGQDKAAHFAVYAGLAAIASFGIRRSPGERAVGWVQLGVPLALAGLYGLSNEIHQCFVPGRSFEFLDLSADVLGALVIQWILCFKVWHIDLVEAPGKT